jgi:hypothetical protein
VFPGTVIRLCWTFGTAHRESRHRWCLCPRPGGQELSMLRQLQYSETPNLRLSISAELLCIDHPQISIVQRLTGSAPSSQRQPRSPDVRMRIDSRGQVVARAVAATSGHFGTSESLERTPARADLNRHEDCTYYGFPYFGRGPLFETLVRLQRWSRFTKSF